MKDILHYAHCTKFTRGQLDREPFSQYEARTVEVETIPSFSEEGEPEWTVKVDGKILACETFLRDAQAIACYELMNQSRDRALHCSNTPQAPQCT